MNTVDNNHKEIILTVFTPAYNRAHTLSRTYQSLQEQDCKEFIWLIIDDGSTDNTEQLVNQWIDNENEFEIRYFRKENGGMHTAHNAAYRQITTELNVCIDSDDKITHGAIRKILDKWTEIKDSGYAGIIALDADFNGKIIGKGFPDNLSETTLVDYYKNGGKGDKKLIYRTDVINAYPEYPVFEGEKYVALAYKYRMIDQDYKLAVLNEVVCDVEYQPDGSTASMLYQYRKNPNGFAFWRKYCMQTPVSRKRQFIDCIHYVSSSLFAGNRKFLKESPCKLITILAVPFGVILTAYIRHKTS